MELTFKSAGVSARTIDLTGPTGIVPLGIPAAVIGTSQKGVAFVPTTVATEQDFHVKFGTPNNDTYQGPLAVSSWLRNQQSATFLRVLGIGEGKKRETGGVNAGRVAGAGFVVGAEQPQESLGGALSSNAYANSGGIKGRMHFLGSFMSETTNSDIFTDAGLPAEGVPMVRALIMAASGVLLRLSSSVGTTDNTPVGSDVAGTNFSGEVTGSVNLLDGRQEFVLLLNGHKGTDSLYPNVITASFDVTAPNYFVNVMNTDPLKLEQAGYVIYREYPVHPAMAVVTGSGIINDAYGALGASNPTAGYEQVAFCLTGSATYNSGSATVPNYENFEDRFTQAKSPWIVSQKFGGSVQNLFRIYALDSGKYPNNRIKFSIENITPGTDVNPYGTFDLLVRDMTDTDKNRIVIEAFRGMNLDPSSDRYIAKVVGDINTFYNFDAQEGRQNLVTDGDYDSKSNFIRVEMAEAVTNEQINDTAIPFGFRGPAHMVTSGSAPLAGLDDTTVFATSNPFYNVVEMPVPYREHLSLGSSPNETVDKGLYWGVQFTRKIDATETNLSTVNETAIASFATFLPTFQTDFVNFVVEDNAGVADTAENGILDADRFNNNAFSLSNIKIVRNQTTDLPDMVNLKDWEYVRGGGITTSGIYRALTPADLEDGTVRQVAKFSFFLQGGFDGTRIFDLETRNLTNNAIQEEMNNVSRGITAGSTVVSYDRALDLIADATEVDVQLLAVPGIRHNIITDKALQTCENRFDAFYIMDIEQYDTNNSLVSSSVDQITSVRFTTNRFRDRGLNSSFGASFFPDLNVRDNAGGTIRTCAPSVAVLGAFGLNDKIGHPWFAPAGFTRGILPEVDESAVRLSRENMDSLQSVNINPIAAFADTNGLTVWGQKTLLASDSSLERINVRRLLIDARRKVRKVANRVVFEDGRVETLQRFEQLVRPIMKRIQNQKGLERYLVKIDAETTTEADIQNRTIRGKIYLVPTKTLEFLSIDFVLTNNP